MIELRLVRLMCCILAVFHALPAASQPREAEYRVPGLNAPAEILVDRWGIPHIYASTSQDAFFVQGYNAARDRLWQIDLWRKRGLGLLASDFGPEYLEQDKAARLFLYRGSMQQEWSAYGRGSREAALAFTAGINAYVRAVERGERPLPNEFRMMGTRPSLWRPEDVVRIRSHALSRNLPSEVARAQVACSAGIEADLLRQHLDPPHRPSAPEGLDPCIVDPAVMTSYRLATGPVSFSVARGRSALGPDEHAGAQGSNAWAVAPSRTATGRPILASDPHREHRVPSLRYLVHVTTPHWSVIGAGEPALPGISIGHNGSLAFGLTIFSADQEDLYVYRLHPQDPRRYRYRNGWEEMRRVRETIAVRGETSREVDLFFTRHGPVLHADPATGRAFALRTIWTEPGTSAYFGGVAAAMAATPREFITAVESWSAPSVNQIYAAADGTIGGLVAGLIPARRNWDGLMPVPGDGRYEWEGFIPRDRLPAPHEPHKGWVASANEMNLPPGYDRAFGPIGFEWPNGARYARIAEVLAAQEHGTLDDAAALQTDAVNSAAPRLVGLLAPLADSHSDLAPAVELLAGWDGAMQPESGAAALFEVWALRHLGPTLMANVAPGPARATVGSGSFATVLTLMEQPDARLGADPDAARDAILAQSLRSAVRDLRTRLGEDPAEWSWGRLHHARPEHPLSPLDPERLGFDSHPLGGGYLTPLASGWRPQDFRSSVGASLRLLIDVGAWDNSRAINMPGQSGDPGSPHFRDHYRLWVNGNYVPLLYSREAVTEATALRIRLLPGDSRRR